MHIPASDMSVRPELSLQALNGEYIQPEAGGDLLRDGAGVLPTGPLRDSMQRRMWLERKYWCLQSLASTFSALLACAVCSVHCCTCIAEHFVPVPTVVGIVFLLHGPR